MSDEMIKIAQEYDAAGRFMAQGFVDEFTKLAYNLEIEKVGEPWEDRVGATPKMRLQRQRGLVQGMAKNRESARQKSRAAGRKASAASARAELLERKAKTRQRGAEGHAAVVKRMRRMDPARTPAEKKQYAKDKTLASAALWTHYNRGQEAKAQARKERLDANIQRDVSKDHQGHAERAFRRYKDLSYKP